MITGKLYDYLKWTGQVILPGIGTLYVALSALWGLPAPLEVSGTILALDTFLGAVLGISQVNYGKQISQGEMHIDETDDKISHKLIVEDPDAIAKKKEVRLRVIKNEQRWDK